jgi:hypothetical protein
VLVKWNSPRSGEEVVVMVEVEEEEVMGGGDGEGEDIVQLRRPVDSLIDIGSLELTVAG